MHFLLCWWSPVEELNISNTGQITADFYLALDTKDKTMFKRTLLLSFIVTFFTAVVRRGCVCVCVNISISVSIYAIVFV